MTTPATLTLGQAVLRVAVLTWLARHVKAELDTARKATAAMLGTGGARVALTPAGDKLGRIHVTNPKPVAEVDSQIPFTEWMVDRYSDRVRYQIELSGPRDQVYAAHQVLQQQFPDLLAATRIAVADWAVNEVLKLSAAAGEPVGPSGESGPDAPPGITVQTPDGVPTVRLAEDAEQIIRELWAHGALGLDGTVRMYALEPPEEAGGVLPRDTSVVDAGIETGIDRAERLARVQFDDDGNEQS